MSQFETYKLVKLLASSPLGDGGIVLNDNFRALADATSGYSHRQTTASTVWTIAHRLKKPVHVTITLDDGEVVYGDLKYRDSDTVIATFSQAISGTAYIG